MAENNFKVGDRVVMSKHFSEEDLQGAIGTVTHIKDAGRYFPIAVSLDNDDSEYPWMVRPIEIELYERPKPTLADTISLKPSTRRILAHLEKRKVISPMEALHTYGNSRLAASIYDLRKVGYQIKTHLREDEAGHKYARYELLAA